YFQIYGNGALTSVSGVSSLATIGNYLEIYNNPALPSLFGFDALTTVTSYIDISNNGALTTIMDLVKPTGKLATVGGNLSVNSNGQLSTCQPDALKTALGSGFTKTYSNSGNLACSKTCTAGACQ